MTKGANVCVGGCQAMVDSGSMMILGPKLEIKLLNSALGFDVSDNTIDCSKISTLPSLIFFISSFYLNLFSIFFCNSITRCGLCTEW